MFPETSVFATPENLQKCKFLGFRPTESITPVGGALHVITMH